MTTTKTISRMSYVLVGLIVAGLSWLVIASWTFVFIGGLYGRLPTIQCWYAWYLYTAEWSDKWIKLRLLLSGIPPGLLMAGLTYSLGRRYFMGHLTRRLEGNGLRPFERGVTDNHGHARLMTWAEAKALFTGPTQSYGGVVVGIDDQNRLLVDPCSKGSGHSMVIAGSGAGKTVTAITTALMWHGPSVILDPKCRMAAMLYRAMRADGKAVEFLKPGQDGFNALDWIDIKDPLAPMHIRTVVSWLFGETEGRHTDQNSKVFDQAGRNLVTCLLADLMWMEEDNPPKTLQTLRKALSVPDSLLRGHITAIYNESRCEMARQIAGPLSELPHETFASALFNADIATSWLTNPAFSQVVSGSRFRTTDFLNTRMTVFVEIPLAALVTTPALGRVVIGALINAKMQAGGPDKALYLLDEARQLGKMKALEVARDTGREAGVVLHLMWQSVGQIDEVWGRDGRKAWYDSMSWRGYSAVQDIDTAREVSAQSGKFPVMAWSEGDTTGRQLSWGSRMSRNKGVTVNKHEISRDLFNPQEVMTMTPENMFLFARGQYTLLVKKAIWFERPEVARYVETKAADDAERILAEAPGRSEPAEDRQTG